MSRMTLLQIAAFPNAFADQTFHYHESLFRSWHILQLVEDWLMKGVAAPVVVAVLQELRDAPAVTRNADSLTSQEDTLLITVEQLVIHESETESTTAPTSAAAWNAEADKLSEAIALVNSVTILNADVHQATIEHLEVLLGIHANHWMKALKAESQEASHE